MEKAMAAIASEADALDENDPKQAARLMRRLYDVSGMPMDGAVDEAIRRMESGEDPERIEEELGDAFEDPSSGDASTKVRSLARRVLPPSVDPTLYEL
jgi:hypothetical protein